MRILSFSAFRLKFLVAIVLILTASKGHTQTFIPFELTKEGHIVVKAKVNGVDGRFIFDTGAGLTFISKSFSNKVNGLVKEDGRYTAFRATGEQVTLDLYKSKSFSMGSLEKLNQRIAVIDANLGDVDGLISLTIVKDKPFTIDYLNRRIVLETQESLSTIEKSEKEMPIQLDESRDLSLVIFAFFRVNDKMVLQFCIDSGAGNDVYRINSRSISALQIDTANSVKHTVPSVFNPQLKTVIYQMEVKSIAPEALPEIQQRNIKASFIDNLIYDGILSLNWIGRQITIDLQKQKMFVR